MRASGEGATLGTLVKSCETVFHTQMQLEPRDSTLTRPATGPRTGGSGALPAPRGIVLTPHPSPGGSIHGGCPKARSLPSQPRPHQQGAGHLAGPQPPCPAPGSDRGRQDRRWAPSKAPGRPGAGVWVPALSARAGRSSLEPLPMGDGSRLGLGLKPRTGGAQAPRAQRTSSYLVLQ